MANPSMRRLAERLAAMAEAVCEHYLSNGQKNGRYWVVGDVHNSAGRSLYVRLHGPTYGKGAAGKWTDAANPEQHGDLLDLIALNRGLSTAEQLRDEALAFLSEPRSYQKPPRDPVPTNSAPAARRLFAASKPLRGTPAEAFLRSRGITCSLELEALRFHPRCYYKFHNGRAELPALIAAVTDVAGNITAVQRTYLRSDGLEKAPLTEPRRALGDLLGNAVRFGEADDVLVAGEGIETMLSLRSLMPGMPMLAALTATHLAAIHFPRGLKRLYIAADNDKAGREATEALTARAFNAGIDVQFLRSIDNDWNDDLRHHSRAELILRLSGMLVGDDAQRYLRPVAA